MSRFTMKRNDTRPVLIAALTDADGAAVNVTGASIRFLMRLPTTPATLVVDAAATSSDPTGGILQYAWGEGDTDTSGLYYAEFEVTFTDNTVLTAPTDSYIKVIVKDDLG